MLACLPPEELDRALRGWRLPAKTPHTITKIEVLRREIQQIQAQGWAQNINEAEMGVGSVAAPVRNGLGEVVAAVSIAGPVQRLGGESLRRFARPCIEAGLAISRRLGYRDSQRG